MRPFTLSLILGGILIAVTVVPVFAHLYGITPLNECSGDNYDKSGGKGTNSTPADYATANPISGLIPSDTGNAPLTGGDGGKTAPI